ncbi:MAG: haloacid dehalogenase-like hydrolase [Lachnospiraceae bacterium]|nr:haloacid dehalogenase-like hydrolase [Lachnospiraceae bacterium]
MKSDKWKITAIVLAALLVISCICLAAVLYQKGSDGKTGGSENRISAEEALSLWTEGARAKTELISYVQAITDERDPDYIPPARRIAVFDMDGTLCCETDPIYFDHMLFMHRVLNDPSYKATEEELEVADRIFDYINTGKYPEGMDTDHGAGVASSFAGMKLADFDAYVKAYRETPANGYDGMTKGQAFYKPMIQVVNYLQSNGFQVYIVSGTDRFIVRGLVDGTLDIPMNRIIGSDERVAATGQGDEDGLSYTFRAGDELILAGDFMMKTLKMNKVAVIEREIGMQPVLSFGNSSGDFAMDEFVTSGNPYRSLAFQLCCDDTERENGSAEKAEKMRTSCEEHGWIPISMKNDWKTIYGDGVTRKAVPDVEFSEEALEQELSPAA